MSKLIDQCLEEIPGLRYLANQLPGFHDVSIRIALMSTTRAINKGRLSGDPTDYFLSVLYANEKERYNEPLPEDDLGFEEKVASMSAERNRRRKSNRVP